MGVESYYDAEARSVWQGKLVADRKTGEVLGTVKDIVQTDGFRNPAMDYDYSLVMEDGSRLRHYNVKLVKPSPWSLGAPSAPGVYWCETQKPSDTARLLLVRKHSWADSLEFYLHPEAGRVGKPIPGEDIKRYRVAERPSLDD